MINEQRLLDTFLQLVNTNSPPGREAKVAEIVEAELRGLGLEVMRDDACARVGSNTGNLVATWPATGPGTPIFFSAHMDTVQPTEGIQVILEDRIIRTDGTTILGGDDKSGIAAIIEGFRHIHEEKIPHPELQAVITISEEVGLKGARALDTGLLKARMGYVLDTGRPIGAIIVQAPTHDLLAVEIIGKAAHAGAAPEAGISAIQVAAKAIAGMKLGRIDEETTANIGTIHGGEARNIIPEWTKMTAEARSLDTAKLDAQVSHMVEAFRRAADESGARAEISVERSYRTFHLGKDDPVVQIAMAATRKIGFQPDLRSTGGGSDANIFNEKGIPTVVLSTGMDKVHTHQEQLSLDDLLNCTRLVAAIVEEASNRG